MNLNPVRDKFEFRFALGIAVLTGILVVAGWILMIIFGLPGDFWLVTIVSAGVVFYTILALLINWRHERHTVGWLFLITGLIGSFMIFNSGGLFSWGVHWHSRFAKQIIILFDLQLGSAWTFIPITLVLLYFPNGHLPSSRWKPVKFLVLIGFMYTQVQQAFIPWSSKGENPIEFNVNNPLEFAGSEIFINGPVNLFFEALTFLAILGCLAAVIIRFIHSTGVERMQMKWLVYCAVVVILLIFVQLILGIPDTHPEIMWYFTLISPILLTLAIGIAILRYRLFDIDIIIRKTLQYTMLTGLLATIYFGSVIILQNIFVSFSNQQSPIIIVFSTLIIAALFNPLRNRIQDFIDRRFYRKKYDAEQALTQFSATARDEVDMDQLNSALLKVVEQTMRPETVSLWLHSELEDSNQIFKKGSNDEQ